jgi:cyclase
MKSCRSANRPAGTPRVMGTVFAVLLLAALAGASRSRAQDIAGTAIRTSRIQPDLYLLQGYGGNVLLCVGTDGALLVDDEYAVLTDKLVAAIAAVTAQPVKFVLNTHWHDDHTGGNLYFGRAGATIVAQENSRVRMQTGQVMSLYGPQAAYAPIGQPRISFESSMNLSFNGNSIALLHPGPGHTDGDTIVLFRERNVLLTGDLFVGYEYRPPYFDDRNGGSLEGMLRGVERVLSMADEHTVVIPGHGPMATRAEVESYRTQLVTARDSIKQAIARGESEDAVVAAHPMSAFARAGKGTDRWVRIVYREYRPHP